MYRILHDVHAFADLKVRSLVRRFGLVAYAWWWRVLEELAANGGMLDMTDDDFWPHVGELLQCDDVLARRFVARCITLKLLKEKDGCLMSERLHRDMSAYRQKAERARRAANIGWEKRSRTPAERKEEMEAEAIEAFLIEKGKQQ